MSVGGEIGETFSSSCAIIHKDLVHIIANSKGKDLAVGFIVLQLILDLIGDLIPVSNLPISKQKHSIPPLQFIAPLEHVLEWIVDVCATEVGVEVFDLVLGVLGGFVVILNHVSASINPHELVSGTKTDDLEEAIGWETQHE